MNEAILRQLLWISMAACLGLAAGSVRDRPYVVHPDFDQCDNDQCNKIDAIFNKKIDPSLEPCDDFWRYACGKNTSHHRKPQNEQFEFNEMNTNKMKDMEEILLGLISEDKYNAALTFERAVYTNCRDARRGAYTEEAKRHYKNMLMQNVYESNSTGHWSTVDKKHASSGLGFAFFDIDIVQGQNPNSGAPQRFIQISPTTDNVMDMNDLLVSKYMDKLEYDIPLRDFNDNFNYNEANGAKYAALKKFVDDFNKILPYEKSDDSFYRDDGPPRPTTVAEWQRKWNEKALHSQNKINWQSTLNHLFLRVGKDIKHDQEIIVVDEPYFYRLIELLGPSSMSTIVDYINLRFAAKTIGSVVEEYKEKYSIVPPIKGLACTPGLLVGAAHVYAQYYFSRDNKEPLENIFNSVRNVIVKQLGSDNYNLQASSDVTKNFLRQLESSSVQVGPPEWLYNNYLINSFYGGLKPSENYYFNQLKLMEILLKHQLKTFTNPESPLIDYKLFFKSFTDESISFSKYIKQTLLPVRSFSENNFKFVSSQLYDPINYGAAGTVIASEMYLLWLRRIAYDQNAAQCVREQMPKKGGTNEYLLRATAYLLGLRAAYEAWPSKDSYPIQFPLFGAVTDFRLFFLSYADSLCSAPKQRAEYQPYDFINFAVSNSEGFTEAFVCDQSHRMNRRDKCDPLKF